MSDSAMGDCIQVHVHLPESRIGKGETHKVPLLPGNLAEIADDSACGLIPGNNVPTRVRGVAGIRVHAVDHVTDRREHLFGVSSQWQRLEGSYGILRREHPP